MTENNDQNSENLSAIKEIMKSLLEKEGNWVQWGENCQKLYKLGVKPENIFEETGFQVSQQNLIMVAAQVYQSLIKENASQEILDYASGPRSDILYEFRILSQEERLKGVTLAKEKNLDVDEAKMAAKAIKDFSCFSQLPSGFTQKAGDAVAYQYWKNARQNSNLSDKARLIAQALKFAHSTTAQTQIQQLLTDFTINPLQKIPLLPLYRLEIEEALPFIVPLAGTFPLTKEDVLNVPSVQVEEPFRVITASHETKLVPLPGWQVILKAKSPVVIFCNSDELPQSISGKSELVLLVIDRENKIWDDKSYFLVEKDHNLELNWFAQCPPLEIIGQLILILREKKILDENNLAEPWQMDD